VTPHSVTASAHHPRGSLRVGILELSALARLLLPASRAANRPSNAPKYEAIGAEGC
jgi:hypothetical protein